MICLTAVAFLGLAPLPQRVILHPVKDNTLIENATGSVSDGAGPAFRAGRVGLMTGGLRRRGVLAFDVAGAVPAGATINHVTLTLNVAVSPLFDQRDVSVVELASDWGEGTSVSGGGMGAPSTLNDATWIHTFWDTSFWTTAGGDFTGPATTTSVGGFGAHDWSSPAMTAAVQGWLDDPSSNFGWIVLGDESTIQTVRAFHSRESTIVSARPRLSIRYKARKRRRHDGMLQPLVAPSIAHPLAGRLVDARQEARARLERARRFPLEVP